MHASVSAIPFCLRTSDGSLLIRVPDPLSVQQAERFRSAFEAELASGTASAAILDFGGTSLIDSSGIGALVGCLKAARAAALPIEAWSVCPQVQLALELAGLRDLLPVQPDTVAILPGMARRSASERLPVTHPSVRSRTKRLIDIVGAVIGLTFTAVLFVPIAVAIRLDSPGPILFSQPRRGWMGRGFRIWKFRSMVANAEVLRATVKNQAEGAFFKNENDPRITRVGRFLRKTSLDELPQFWNVLVGDMSLIGTRPPTPDEVERYRIPNWQRFDVRPGLSGEWQVSGRSSIRNFEQVVALDLRYQENWSLLYDFKLILRTFAVIFSKQSGAA